MFRGSIPVLVLAACFAEEQHSNTTAYPVGGVSIPAELTFTIRAERVHRGDPVEFRTLEPVLISKGLVMPANTKLTGRVVGAAPLENGKPSWLVLLVEHGEWKNQSVPLHAFIAAPITVSRSPAESRAAADRGTMPRDPRRAARESGRVAALNGVDVSSNTHLPEDSRSAQSSGPAPVPLKDLRIVRDANGITYLVSEHANLKLPGGTLFRLQNESLPAPPAGGTNDKPADEHPSPQ
ncbi:MAG TPA: hypothetical protein VF772_23200 [Terriglobales bacterium]